MCGSLDEEDVVLRLRKVQILNSLGRDETAIAAYHVSDGIDQCHVGFLQRHFVTHAKTFDGALAQVTEVYGSGSESTIKRKNGDTAVVVVLRHLSQIFRHRHNTPVRPPTLSWPKLQKEMKRMKQKKCQDKMK